MAEAPAELMGCLPVIVDVRFWYDEYTMEHDAEVQGVWWRKRDGSKGKEVPQHILDRAATTDYGLCNLIDQVQDHLVHETAPSDPVVDFVVLP